MNPGDGAHGQPAGEGLPTPRYLGRFDREAAEHALQWSLASGQPYDCQFRVVHADGSPRWVHAAARVYLDDNGGPAWMLGIAQDVTARRVHLPRRRPRRFPDPCGRTMVPERDWSHKVIAPALCADWS